MPNYNDIDPSASLFVSKQQIADARRRLFAPISGPRRPDQIDFKVRPISEEWRIFNKLPAFKTAVCNAAYILRDSSPSDRFGPMPASFDQRRYELKGSGLIVPGSAPLWALDPYRIWQEADAATVATGDPTAIAAWHVLLEIPSSIPARAWKWLVTGFVERELVQRGAAVAWAIHAVEGEDGSWLISPHTHLVVSARQWRHTPKHGERHPAWISSWGAQKRLEGAWRRRCNSMGMATRK